MSKQSPYSSQTETVGFALMLNSAPVDTMSAGTVVAFADAALRQGHRIQAVYFYHDAVWHVCESSSDQWAAWQKLSEQGVALMACQAAARRRSIDTSVSPDGFRWSGLPSFFSLLEPDVRLLEFGRCGAVV